MSGKNKGALKGIIIGALMVLLILGYFFYLSNKKTDAGSEDIEVKVSPVQGALLRNLDTDYPPTPKEVLKLYCDYTVLFYSTDYSEAEFEALALQIRKLYDEELQNNMTLDQYLENFRYDVDNMKAQGLSVTSYSTSSAVDVEEFTKDGRDCARLYATFTLKNGKDVGLTKEVFILRRDENKHWKIMGWKVVELNE